MKKLFLFSVVIALCGCQSRLYTIQAAESIAQEYGITSPVIWSSEYGNPYAQDGTIYVSLEWISEHNLSSVLGCVLLHEEYHILGYGHCENKKCLMYETYQVDIIFGAKEKTLCGKCKLAQKDWLGLK